MMGLGNRGSAKKPKVKLECFMGCASLGSTDLPKKEAFCPFAVVYIQQEATDNFTEIARTETCSFTSSPFWCTSFEVECKAQEIGIARLQIEIYHRVQDGVESLCDNELLGRAVVPVQQVTEAPGMHFLAPLSHPTREREKVGILQLHAEHVSQSPNTTELVELDVLAAVLRRRDWANASKLVPQSFEILRAHEHDDNDGYVVWVPVHRSDRNAKHDKSSEYLEFSRATLTNRHLCNGDEERRIRIALQAGSVDKKTGRPFDMGFADITLRDLCEVDPTEEVFEIERADDGGDDQRNVGSLTLQVAQPTEVGSHFVLQINHASCSKYISTCASASATSGHSKHRMSAMLKHRSPRRLKMGSSKKHGKSNKNADDSNLHSPLSSAANCPTGAEPLEPEREALAAGPISSMSLFTDDTFSVASKCTFARPNSGETDKASGTAGTAATPDSPVTGDEQAVVHANASK